MGATKRLYEDIIGKYDNLEANFKFLEEEYFEECSRCEEKHHVDNMFYIGTAMPLCDCCNGDLNG